MEMSPALCTGRTGRNLLSLYFRVSFHFLFFFFTILQGSLPESVLPPRRMVCWRSVRHFPSTGGCCVLELEKCPVGKRCVSALLCVRVLV
ncbi:hypothetical protein GDO81_009991 [Engystomops pustulosus]|uniref:Secreted protein n=1 Tax=Engystomops pustulosus TaxID=76066 RepID=A0AAV7BWQ2_ENGPU|nr:hypothetical protein GDO81_009991 [Engystomops pustulosus]